MMIPNPNRVLLGMMLGLTIVTVAGALAACQPIEKKSWWRYDRVVEMNCYTTTTTPPQKIWLRIAQPDFGDIIKLYTRHGVCIPSGLTPSGGVIKLRT